MKLTYHEGPPANFGDALNATLWERMLPDGFLDEDQSELFLGAGSIINIRHAAEATKHVMGSGYGGYTEAPDVSDGSWNFVWVRGPRTARRFGLAPERGIVDSAMLIRRTDLMPTAGQGRRRAAFMPHVDSIARGNWAGACALADIDFLDPREDVGDLLERMASASVVITEAMHGAILADALRVPWIAILPTLPLHREKWLDWSESLDVALRRHKVPGSNIGEEWARWSGWDARGYRTRQVVNHPLLRPANALCAQRAARALCHLRDQQEPQLSTDAALDSALDRASEALARFVKARGFGNLKI